MITLSRYNKNGLVFRFEEKHRNRLFYCKTQEEINNMFMKLVKQRYEEGYWYQFDVKSDEEKKSFLERIEKLEKEAGEYEGTYCIKEAFKKEIEILKNELSWFKDCSMMSKLLKMAIDKGNVKAANQLCEDRMDYQYEGFEYDDAEEI